MLRKSTYKMALTVGATIALSGCSTLSSIKSNLFSSDLKCASAAVSMDSPCGRLEPINNTKPVDMPPSLRGPYQFDTYEHEAYEIEIYEEDFKLDV